MAIEFGELAGFSLDLEGIHRFQRNRYPYLLIDYVDEVVPGEYARGYKDLAEDTWFFDVHWPGDPNMPGMLQIEALVQMAALSVLTLDQYRGEVVYLTEVKNARFSQKVVPGDRLYLDTRLTSFRRGIGKCSGKGSVTGTKVCQADFGIILPSVVSKYTDAKQDRR